MPQTFYTEEEYNDIQVLVNILNTIAHQQSGICRMAKCEEEHSERYKYIPERVESFIKALSVVKAHIRAKMLNKRLTRFHEYTFVSAGCGYPINLMIASAYGFNTIGYEIDDTIIKMSEGLGANIHKQDILTASYHSFDVIYYYRPLRDNMLQQILETKIEAEMKEGAYLMCSLKKDNTIEKKKEFKLLDDREGMRVYYKEVKS